MFHQSQPSRKRGRRILRRYLGFFLLTLLIPLLLIGFFYVIQARQIDLEIKALKEDNLEFNRRIVESAIHNITSIVSEIRQEETIDYLLDLPYPLNAVQIFQAGQAHRESILSRAQDPYLLDIIIYLNAPKLILTQNDVYFRTDLFYPYFYEEEGVSLNQWVAALRDRSYHNLTASIRNVRFKQSSREVIVFQTSLPNIVLQESRGTILALIDKTGIQELMRDRLAAEEGFAYIQMQNGDLFAHVASPEFENAVLTDLTGGSGVRYERISGRWVTISYVRSPTNGWLYVAGRPGSILSTLGSRIQILFGLLVLAIGLAGIPLVIFLARRSSRPLIRISEILKNDVMLPEPKGINPMQVITNAIGEILDRNSTLNSLLEEQKPFMKSMFIDRLFRGEFASEEEIRASFIHTGINLSGSSYGVICVYIDGFYDEVDSGIFREFLVKNTIIRNILVDILPAESLVHEISLNQIGLILMFNGHEKKQNERTFDDITAGIGDRLGTQKEIRCLVERGPVVKSLHEVESSLQEAIRRINQSSDGVNLLTDKQRGQKRISDRHRKESFYFPVELELKIISLAVSGRMQDVKKIVDNLREENIANRHLTLELEKALAAELETTRLRILDRLAIDPNSRINTQKAPQSIKEMLLVLFDDLINIAGDAALQSSSFRFKQPVLDFVNANYMNPEMSLKYLGLEFRLSEAYLSRHFSEISGKNFFTYVEDLRIAQAKTSLKSGQLTVDEVAYQVGYTSSHAFRRAFKRRTGVLPSSYR